MQEIRRKKQELVVKIQKSTYKQIHINTMSKKVKIAFAIGLQLAMIGSIGSFVKWPYMNYVFIASGISFFLTVIFFLIEMNKE